MANWKNININKNMIDTDTGSAIKINMPHSSRYDGYSFWHPTKLVRHGRHSAAVSIGYNDEFKFKLKKYGKGNFNRFDVLDEIEISAKDFEEVFGVVNENITAPKFKDPFETRKPATINAEETKVIEELKDNE